MKIYIAGPMTGYNDYNRDAFNDAADDLRSLGHVAINPAVLPDGLEQAEYMDICLAMIRSADGVLFLDGFENSLGAKVEFAYAEKLGLHLFIISKDERKKVKLGLRPLFRKFTLCEVLNR